MKSNLLETESLTDCAMKEKNNPKIKILICGVLPPPNIGHSMMYKMLMGSSFVEDCDITFLNMKSGVYPGHKGIAFGKPLITLKHWILYVFLIIANRQRYVLYDMSFDKTTYWRDYFFCWTGKILGCRIVLHDMGQYLPELYELSGSLMRGSIKKLLCMTFAIIVIGKKVRQTYSSFIELQKIVVVQGSVEDTAGMIVPTNRKEGILEVFYLSSLLSDSKGLWTALKAIPAVVRKNSRIHFTFGGPIESEQLHEQMQDFIKEQGLQPYVSYVGYIEDVVQRTSYYRDADIFIFPTHRDSFGLVMLHAMAEGVPVVASIEGTILEIIEDGVNGLLFDKGDKDQLAQKILQLAGDAHLRQQMGVANRKKYLSHFSPQVFGRRMVEAFGQIEEELKV